MGLPAFSSAARLLAVVSFGLTAMSCASTRIDSMPAPELSGKEFRRILVVVPLENVGTRRHAEMRFREAYRADTGLFVPSHTVLFPGRAYSEVQFDSILTVHRIDAVLMLTELARGLRESSQAVSTCTLWTASGCAQSVTSDASEQLPWARLRAELIDPKSRDAIWIASIESKGGSLASFNTLFSSVARRTVSQLIRDQVLPPQ